MIFVFGGGKITQCWSYLSRQWLVKHNTCDNLGNNQVCSVVTVCCTNHFIVYQHRSQSVLYGVAVAGMQAFRSSICNHRCLLSNIWRWWQQASLNYFSLVNNSKTLYKASIVRSYKEYLPMEYSIHPVKCCSEGVVMPIFEAINCPTRRIMWGLFVCQEQVSRGGINNYIPEYLYGM